MHTSYSDEKINPNSKQPVTLYSESFVIRLRDYFTYCLFYHTKKSLLTIALLVLLGIAMIACPWIFMVPLALAISLTVLGSLLCLITTIALYIEVHVFGWDAPNNTDEFKSFSNITLANGAVASMEYTVGCSEFGQPMKVPQLRIDADTHEQAGYAQGYLLGKQGDEMVSRLKKLYRVLRLLNYVGLKLPVWGETPFIQPFFDRLPAELQAQLQGVLKGHNQWAKENKAKPLTLGDLMMLHFLPDAHNLKQLFMAGEILSTGCTAGLIKNRDGTVTHFRNTDWPSYNIAQRVSIMVELRIKGKPVTRTLTFPLCIGCAFGEQESGLTLSINVSPGAAVYNDKGMLAFLLYRKLLNECTSVNEVLQRIMHDPDYQPIGPCQLTVSDKKDGAIIRFYQAATHDATEIPDGQFKIKNDTVYFTHHVTHLSGKAPLIVVANESLVYNKKSKQFLHGNHHDSKQRIANVWSRLYKAVLIGRVKTQDIWEALKQPLVNNCETVHTVIKTKPEDGGTNVGMANGFAARFFPASLKAISTHDSDVKLNP